LLDVDVLELERDLVHEALHELRDELARESRGHADAHGLLRHPGQARVVGDEVADLCPELVPLLLQGGDLLAQLARGLAAGPASARAGGAEDEAREGEGDRAPRSHFVRSSPFVRLAPSRFAAAGFAFSSAPRLAPTSSAVRSVASGASVVFTRSPGLKRMPIQSRPLPAKIRSTLASIAMRAPAMRTGRSVTAGRSKDFSMRTGILITGSFPAIPRRKARASSSRVAPLSSDSTPAAFSSWMWSTAIVALRVEVSGSMSILAMGPITSTVASMSTTPSRASDPRSLMVGAPRNRTSATLSTIRYLCAPVSKCSCDV